MCDEVWCGGEAAAACCRRPLAADTLLGRARPRTAADVCAADAPHHRRSARRRGLGARAQVGRLPRPAALRRPCGDAAHPQRPRVLRGFPRAGRHRQRTRQASRDPRRRARLPARRRASGLRSATTPPHRLGRQPAPAMLQVFDLLHLDGRSTRAPPLPRAPGSARGAGARRTRVAHAGEHGPRPVRLRSSRASPSSVWRASSPSALTPATRRAGEAPPGSSTSSDETSGSRSPASDDAPRQAGRDLCRAPLADGSLTGAGSIELGLQPDLIEVLELRLADAGGAATRRRRLVPAGGVSGRVVSRSTRRRGPGRGAARHRPQLTGGDRQHRPLCAALSGLSSRLCSGPAGGATVALVRPLGFRFDVDAVIVGGMAHRANCGELPPHLPPDSVAVPAVGVHRAELCPRECPHCRPPFETLLSYQLEPVATAPSPLIAPRARASRSAARARRRRARSAGFASGAGSRRPRAPAS